MKRKTPTIYPPIRFKTAEDGIKWLHTSDMSLAVPSHIKQGDKIVPNPEHEAANFEVKWIVHPSVIKVKTPSG